MITSGSIRRVGGAVGGLMGGWWGGVALIQFTGGSDLLFTVPRWDDLFFMFLFQVCFNHVSNPHLAVVVRF